ncbi:hypothetical protein BTS2_3888 [Bacillus sp. TS-2]|nr:hypothetical protein BTS2_3888 [Bacillus sp. TS-2]
MITLKVTLELVMNTVVLGLFTTLIISDFFPALNIHSSLIIWGIILSIILTIIVTKFSRKKMNVEKKKGSTAIYSSLYLFILLLILTWLGGQSTVGIGLENHIIWFLIFFPIMTAIYKIIYKRVAPNKQKV